MLGSETTPVLIATYDNEISINLIFFSPFLFNFTITLWNRVARWGQKICFSNGTGSQTRQNLRKRVTVTEMWNILTIGVRGRLWLQKSPKIYWNKHHVNRWYENIHLLCEYDKTFQKIMWLGQVTPACLGCVCTKSGAASNPGRVVWRLCVTVLCWGQITNSHDWLCDQKRSRFHYRCTTSVSLRYDSWRLGLAAVNAASHLNQTQCAALSMLHSFPALVLGFDPEVQQLKSSRRRRMWQNKMKETTWWVLCTCCHITFVNWMDCVWCACILEQGQ